jgi:hypothetical protein
MKSLRTILIGLTVLGITVFLSGASFAQETPAVGKDPAARQARHEARIKVLQDSAAALQQSDPILSTDLIKFANDEISEKQEKEEKNEVKEMKEPESMPGYREAHIKLLKDSAAALQQSHPDLAKSLEEMAAAKHKTKMQKASEEKNEKEEVGEKVEPKGDK